MPQAMNGLTVKQIADREFRRTRMTVKLAKQTVKASYPKACCRHGWRMVKEVRVDDYTIFATLRSGHFIGGSWREPLRLGTAATANEAWIIAARKLVDLANPVQVSAR